MIPEELPNRKAFAARAVSTHGVAVAVCVAVGSNRGCQEEVSAPGVFVARGHFVGKPYVILVLERSERAEWITAMAISTRVCTSMKKEVNDDSERL